MKLQFKLGIFIALITFAAYGGWKTHAWYTGAQVKDALEHAIEQANERAEQDAEILMGGLQEEESVRTVFVEVKNEASGTELCTDGGNDFLGVFNNAVGAANPE